MKKQTSLPIVQAVYNGTHVNEAITGMVWEDRRRPGVAFSGNINITLGDTTYIARISLWDRGELQSDGRRQLSVTSDMPIPNDAIVAGKTNKELMELKKLIDSKVAEKRSRLTIDEQASNQRMADEEALERARAFDLSDDEIPF